MSGKAAFDRKLEELSALRSDPASPEALAQLRKALGDRSNFIVSKAAALVEELGLRDLLPDLLKAYDRFFQDPIKTDPQCWAKNAIAKALLTLEFEGPEAYIRGHRYVQPEPSWGGTEDSATTLRATCLLGLVQNSKLSSFDLLELLVDCFNDPATGVRSEVARAIGMLGKAEGALILRMKVQGGDREPSVIGACFASLLHLQRGGAVSFVARYLDEPEYQFEAAAALGETREAESVQALTSCWQKARDRQFKRAVLISIGASRQDSAVAWLVKLIEDGTIQQALEAVEALAPNLYHDDTVQQVRRAVEARESSDLAEAFRKQLHATGR